MSMYSLRLLAPFAVHEFQHGNSLYRNGKILGWNSTYTTAGLSGRVGQVFYDRYTRFCLAYTGSFFAEEQS